MFHSVGAHAGFFSDIIRFIAGSNTVAAQDQTTAIASISMPLMGGQGGISQDKKDIGGPTAGSLPSILATQDNALVGQRNPLGTLPSDYNDSIIVYTVLEDDTPSSIAERFGISLNTLLWANNIRNPDLIKIGDELVILPVSGVKYEVKKGDTVESIAKKFKGDVGEILIFNGIGVGEPIKTGTTIIIPDGEIETAPQPQTRVTLFSALPEIQGYYLRPIIGGRNVRATAKNPHGIHGFNGVDLSLGFCGGTVLASAEGTVILARFTGWNGGYGRYVVLAHSNGTQTLYGHLGSILTGVGQRVTQGTHIGTIGATGNSTGCHLHFEIRGAKNPF